MKIREKFKNLNWDNEVEHMVALAYLAGKEEATKRICDIHNTQISQMQNRAKSCRYYKMAYSIIGGNNIIYSPDYAGDVTSELCNDEWTLTK